jgi:hypothetical protein
MRLHSIRIESQVGGAGSPSRVSKPECSASVQKDEK